MKKILLLLCIVFSVIPLAAQKYSLSGYIKDKSSGEGLIGATVFIQELKTGVVSNSYGFYSITVPKGNYNIVYSSMGFQTQTQKLDFTKNQHLDIMMDVAVKEINEVVVSGEKSNKNVESIQMSMEKLPVKMIQKLPAFMGEVDIIKSIDLLPGIQNGGEGSSALYVRGGGPDENLMMLDESPVYNASHLMGFFSVFNSDAIKDLQIYKGGIPAEYGGKASSVIDIRMKDGNTQDYHAQGGIGWISSRLTVEGPVIKDKWSCIVSGRRTYADYIGRLAGVEQLKENKLYFYDINGKTNVELGRNDRIYLSVYTGDDYFSLGNAVYMRWGNLTSTLRWSHIFGDRLFSNTSVIYSKYRYNLGTPGDGADQFDWTSMIRDYNVKEDITWFLNPQNKINIGFNAIYHHFEPGNLDANEKSYFHDINLTNYNAIENSIYISNEQAVGDRITLKYGLRYSMFQQIGKGKMREYRDPENPVTQDTIGVRSFGSWEAIGPYYGNFEPRLGIKLTLDENSSVKASYNRMVQNLHLISNTNSPTPLDIWLPSNKYIKPLIADQYALGYFRNFKENTYETSVEVYYKKMQNIIDYKDGAELFLREDIETELLRGDGYSYGLELLAKKQQGKFTGWASYTYAHTYRKVPGINEGKEYPSSYDRTNDISLVLSYQLTNYWTVAANWVYSTGNATTYPAAKYVISGNTVYHYSSRNGYRIPDYHRLDLSLNYDFKGNDRRKFKQSFNISIYNVYCRRNAYSVYFRENEDNPNKTEAVRLSIVGFLVPSFTYNFSF